MEIGRPEGEEYGRREGEKIGHLSVVLQTLFSLVKSGILEPALAARQAGLSEADFEKLMESREEQGESPL
ncbi:MAG: hypothetical protein K2N94_02060, partial [Lachnospiraceae bacterium]|nr:hypothetical protein [Lachnospiraceae bacterium]